jgi:hypothetical protein
MDMNVSQLLRDPTGAMREYDIDEAIDITGEGKTERPLQYAPHPAQHPRQMRPEFGY